MKETECFGDWVVTTFGPEDPHYGPEGPPCYPDGLGDDKPCYGPLNPH